MEQSGLHQERMQRFTDDVTLYPVSCERLAVGRSDGEWLEAVLAGGARIVQLRDKESDDRTLYDKALLFRRKTRDAGALLIVNNRVDLALLVEADGVHLGNTDLPVAAVRQWAPDLIIGVSCNTLEQAETVADRGGSYYNIGPLFATATKEGLSRFLGVEAISRFSTASRLPFTVMGGIKLSHVAEMIRAGAQRIAVVTALTQAPDIAAATRRWLATIQQEVESCRARP